MAVRLDLLAHGATAATRLARFPDDESLDATAVGAKFRASQAYDRVLTSPGRAAVETAQALGVDSSIDPMLRDCDYGRWRGQRSRNVAQNEPESFAVWLSDPNATPHDGESVASLVERLKTWLDAGLLRDGAVLAITHAPVVRASVVAALGLPNSAFWRIDVAPLSFVRMSGRAERWNLSALGPWDLRP